MRNNTWGIMCMKMAVANFTAEYSNRDEYVRSTSVRSKRQGDQRGWEG
jgi:hypothetical protein